MRGVCAVAFGARRAGLGVTGKVLPFREPSRPDDDEAVVEHDRLNAWEWLCREMETALWDERRPWVREGYEDEED